MSPPLLSWEENCNVKKLLSALLAASMLLSMAACSSMLRFGNGANSIFPSSRPISTDQPVPETPKPTEKPVPQTPAPTGKPEVTTDQLLGVYYEASNTYENEFVGIGCKLDEEWEVYDADQIAALNGMVVDLMTDETLANMLENSGSLMPFYAQANDGLVTLNITVENLGLLYGSMLDEQGYVELSIGQLAPALESIGLTDITTEISSVTFAGGKHAAIMVSASFQGVEFHETLVCVKVGRYIANITAASYLADVTGEVLSMFYSL